MELPELLDLRFPVFSQIEFKERLFVHLVLLDQVGVEPIDDTVCQNAKSGIRYVEIAEQLTIVGAEVFFPMLAFNQYDGLAVLVDCVIYFLTLFYSNITSVLGDDLRGVEYIVTERLNHRHDERCLGCLFGLDIFFEFDNAVTQLFYLVFEVHIGCFSCWIHNLFSICLRTAFRYNTYSRNCLSGSGICSPARPLFGMPPGRILPW